jgi:iron-sulfur cluster repair protein YtfE (RIC family)
VTAIRESSLSELLSAGHRLLDQLLARAKGHLAAGDIGRAGREFAAFREGLDGHIAAEEAALFPALERCEGSSACELTRGLRAEHAELKRLLESVERALTSGRPLNRTTPLPALTARIYAHNGKEERLLHPLVEALNASARDRTELVRQLVGLTPLAEGRGLARARSPEAG